MEQFVALILWFAGKVHAQLLEHAHIYLGQDDGGS